ncbi:sugar ABC transporter ATP-binding protein [Dyadobacter luticola]|uniref:Sugar ABC transporter ATP-binding protein n=1 Tax=Dyadobacter luticola TaxID=1979387 RepID=A0A5R9L3Q8_9BACT|nr:sugar ABC transporter ATP-binding protein [Dyadobacter luticola]TLV03214.1 sugar ABC transporter ATP-binding protein [Dyadobacter luticola]
MRLEVKGISKSFGPVKAVQNISFDLAVGEVHAICGENGAGKSTLMNILSGNLAPDAGEILLDGNVIKPKNQLHANDLGIAIVYQHLSLFDNQNVAENIFVNRFPKTKSGLIDYKAAYSGTAQLLQQLCIDPILSPDTQVSELSAGQKQMVEIAKALAKNPSVLILDEPTASISGSDTQTLFNIIRDLKNKGTSIIYISHRMEEIFEISDRVTVLKDGQMVGVAQTSTLTREILINKMVGRDIQKLERRQTLSGDTVLEVKGLSNKKLHEVSFKICKGEIVALAGLIGAGRTEIAKSIFGAMPLDAGEIYLNGQKINIQSPADAVHFKIAYVPEERKSLGLFAAMSLSENIDSINYTSDNAFWSDSKMALGRAEDFRQRLRIVSHSATQPVADLSGGNQQKVVLAKWLSTDPDLLMIDEPTHGIDIGAKFEIYELLQNLAQKGKAILLISSELQEVLAISDRILVVKNGAIVQELKTGETSEGEILQWAM